jgi:hypothetical protein
MPGSTVDRARGMRAARAGRVRGARGAQTWRRKWGGASRIYPPLSR